MVGPILGGLYLPSHRAIWKQFYWPLAARDNTVTVRSLKQSSQRQPHGWLKLSRQNTSSSPSPHTTPSPSSLFSSGCSSVSHFLSEVCLFTFFCAMFRSMVPARSALRTARPQAVPSPIVSAPSLALFGRRGYASQSEDHDLVIIGGGVAGYVAAIKAGQEGLKVMIFVPKS